MPASAPSAAAARCAATTTTPEGRFPNPLHGCRTADPGIVRVGDTWYVVSTGGDRASGAFPIRRSIGDRKTWTHIGSIFPPGRVPAWTGSSDQYWAPQIYAIGGRYVAYYSAIGPSRYFSIGAATAPNPAGPWRDLGRPLVTNANFSLIDPYFFHDPKSGRQYLLWKNNVNPQGRPTHIVIHEVSADGLGLRGSSHHLLVNDQGWEGAVIEAPSMAYRDGFYYLFYSGNTFSSGRYAVGVARSTSPTGGFRKLPLPILRSNGRFSGPGGQDVVRGPDGEWIVFYHADPTFAPFDQDKGRYLMMDQITWGADGWPRVHNGTPST